MSIVILGWGSLVWNPSELPTIGDFVSGGPILPLEFSRISRDGRLTLVIDVENGERCETYFARSARRDLDEAVTDLTNREQTSRERIGLVDLTDGGQHGDNATTIQTISYWADKQKVGAAIWTDLPPNFSDKTGSAFNVEEAINHIRNLPPVDKARAIEYITRAPIEIDTPVRRAFRASGLTN